MNASEVQARLAAIREREGKATPGPWRVYRQPGFVSVVSADFDPARRFPHDTPLCGMYQRRSISDAGGGMALDAAFLAHARADVPYLLAVAEAAAAFLDRWYAGDGGDADTCEAAIALQRALGGEA